MYYHYNTALEVTVPDNLFGRFFAEIRRKRLKLSLREFCERNDLDPGNVSKLERGKLPPPQGKDVLERYARALELEEDSDDWYRFLDLAAATRGEIPAELMEDDEVVQHLPVFFRSLRGQRVSEEQLRKLLELIRKS